MAGIDITVMLCVAIWTSPIPHRQWQIVQLMITMRARFRIGKEPVYLEYIFTIPFGFVAKQGNQLPPSGIANGFGEFAVLDHVFYT